MAQKGKGVGAAVGLPQALPVHEAGKLHVVRRGLHRPADLRRDQPRVRPAEPQKANLRQTVGQLQELGQPLPGDGVPHGDDSLFPFTEPIPPSKSVPQRWVRSEKRSVHAVGDAVHRPLQAVALQQASGVLRGRQHHIAQAVAKDDPPPEQRRQLVRAPEGAPEILHGGVTVPDHLPAPQLCRQRRHDGVRQHRVHMDGRRVPRPPVRQRDACPPQARLLMADGLSHAASPNQLLSSAINIDSHFGLLIRTGPSRPWSGPGCTGQWQRACLAE